MMRIKITHSRLRKIAIWLALIGLLLQPLPNLAFAQSNLLSNPSFEEGWYHQDNTPELAVPLGWRVHFVDGAGFPGIAEGAVAYRPETVVWWIQHAPDHERGIFFRDGSFVVKMFKPWAPVYMGISQDVSGLQAGQQYEFVARVYVDVIEYYSGGNKVPPSNESGGVGIRLGNSPLGAAWRSESQINYGGFATAGNTFPFHQSYLTLRHRFTATESTATVWLEMYSRFGYVNNGFFLDDFELIPIGPPPTATTAPTEQGEPTNTPTDSAPAQPTPTATPTTQPTATQTPAPSPTPAPNTILYVVQRGDNLYRIARNHGVTIDQIAALNGIVNRNLLYVGTTLKIPVTGGGQTTAPVVQPSPSPTPGTNTTTTTTTATTVDASPVQTYTVQSGDRLATIARRFGLTPAVLASENGLNNINLIYVGQVLRIPDPSRYYTVQAGDNLATIARRFGTTLDALVTANRLRNPDMIYRGQVLIIP